MSQVRSSEFSKGHHVVIACVEHNSLLIFNCIAQIEHLSPRYSDVHLCILQRKLYLRVKIEWVLRGLLMLRRVSRLMK